MTDFHTTRLDADTVQYLLESGFAVGDGAVYLLENRSGQCGVIPHADIVAPRTLEAAIPEQPEVEKNCPQDFCLPTFASLNIQLSNKLIMSQFRLEADLIKSGTETKLEISYSPSAIFSHERWLTSLTVDNAETNIQNILYGDADADGRTDVLVVLSTGAGILLQGRNSNSETPQDKAVDGNWLYSQKRQIPSSFGQHQPLQFIRPLHQELVRKDLAWDEIVVQGLAHLFATMASTGMSVSNDPDKAQE